MRLSAEQIVTAIVAELRIQSSGPEGVWVGARGDNNYCTIDGYVNLIDIAHAILKAEAAT